MRIKAKPLITRLNKGVLWVNLRFTAFWLTKTFDYQDCDFYDIDDTFLRSRQLFNINAHLFWGGFLMIPEAFLATLFMVRTIFMTGCLFDRTFLFIFSWSLYINFTDPALFIFFFASNHTLSKIKIFLFIRSLIFYFRRSLSKIKVTLFLRPRSRPSLFKINNSHSFTLQQTL